MTGRTQGTSSDRRPKFKIFDNSLTEDKIRFYFPVSNWRWDWCLDQV